MLEQDVSLSEKGKSKSIRTSKGNQSYMNLRTIYLSSIAVGFILRLVSSLQAWGMKHPDEIFQSLEMAHYLVFGSGFVPPEFQSSNPITPSYAAARSWLFPYFFAGFMWVGKFLHLSYLDQTLVIIKIYMAIHATLLIPAVYKFTQQLTKNELSATMAAVAVALWFRVIEYTVRTFTNTFFLPLIFYGLYRLFKGLEEDHLGIRDLIEIGFYLGISTYIRMDMGIIIFAFFLVYFQKKHIFKYFEVGVFSMIYWLWAAWIDYRQYDGAQYFSVPINWFTFNIIEGYSKNFGVSPPFDYIGAMLIADLLFPWFIIVVGWPLLVLIKKNKSSILLTEEGKIFLKLTMATLITWIIYSNLWPVFSLHPFSVTIPWSHKEKRFVIGAVTLFLVDAAVATRLVAAALPQFIDNRANLPVNNFKVVDFRLTYYRQRVLMVFAILFIILSFMGSIYRADSDHHEGIDLSLRYIGHQKNVDTIVVAEYWFNTGFRTYSHTNNSVQFTFLPLQVDETRADNTKTIEGIIDSKLQNLYMVLPDYSYYFDPQLKQELYRNGWTNVYSAKTVDTWTFIPS